MEAERPQQEVLLEAETPEQEELLEPKMPKQEDLLEADKSEQGVVMTLTLITRPESPTFMRTTKCRSTAAHRIAVYPSGRRLAKQPSLFIRLVYRLPSTVLAESLPMPEGPGETGRACWDPGG